MPARRVWRYKARVSAITKFEWEFFLVQDVAGFDRLAERQGDDAAEFFNLFYADGWRELYASHAQEIEAEWRRHKWSRRQRKFILTGYFERHITLRHDAESELKMRWWHEWEGCEGWKTETFPQYLERMRKERDFTELITEPIRPWNLMEVLTTSPRSVARPRERFDRRAPIDEAPCGLYWIPWSITFRPMR